MRPKIPNRPRAPQWKIFDAEGLYMGSLHEPTDAAFVIGNYAHGSQIRFGRDPEDTVWTEGDDGDASASYDMAVTMMLERLDRIHERRRKVSAELMARMRRSIS